VSAVASSKAVTVTVNGVVKTCGAVPLPAKAPDGFRYFAFSAGTFPWASFFWFQ